MVVLVQRILSVLVVHPCDHEAAWVLRLTATAQKHERVSIHIASLGKDQNSKFEVQFLLNVYHFHTIKKPKNLKWNHRKSGTICNEL